MKFCLRLNFLQQTWNKGRLFPVHSNLKSVQSRIFCTKLANDTLKETRQKKIVGWWFIGCAGMVFGAVTIGGLTRLTESGLSIVDWKLLKGMKPPSSEAEWQTEFEKYKFYPEYHMKNSQQVEEMSLNEFKFIFYMEYAHRMWGRFIGLSFFLPAAYFWFRGRFDKPMKKRVVFAGGLLLFQGLLGWYMVKSGLDPSQNSDTEIARVSHYRLAAHLSTAFVLYSVLVWCGLSKLFVPIDYNAIPKIKAVRGMAHFSKTALFTTAVFGALVAGLDAGLVHGTWPKYTGKWLPDDLWLKEMKNRNWTENPTMVQFLHRNFAYLSIAAVTAMWFVGRRLPLNKRTVGVLNALAAVSYLQVTLGVAALVHEVPVYMAALHQNCFMVVLALAFWFAHEIRRFPVKI